MQLIQSLTEMQSEAIRMRTSGRLIALIPTSGYLNNGHLELVRHAREDADVVVLSVLVNPKEFGPNEDYKIYPRDRDRDEAFCRDNGVDILFYPEVENFYPDKYSTFVNETAISQSMCGISRPHYFQGVCTAHAKLFNLVRPDRVWLGMRDAQKCGVIRKMVEELHFPLDVSVIDVVRDADGLPFNARLKYLNDFQLKDAKQIYPAILEGKKIVESGINNVDRVLAEVIHHLSLNRRIRIIYVVAIDEETLKPVRQINPGKTLIVASVWVDEVRLLDCVRV